ncbi:MAG TPA: VWA domain-containing protein [Steroidobacteraceae bacterium]|nr:VWA domain-containing protein [Steroidobacteraceae bacterium]
MEVKLMSLRRRASVVAALACALWSFDASAAVSLRVDAQPVADPIQVWVSVTNSSGGPVTGLQASDFTVSVDGTQVSSPTFSLPPSGGGGNVSVVLAMDMSQTVRSAALESMQAAVIQFIDSMQNGDYAAIVKFNNTNPQKASVVQDFTEIDGLGGNSALESAVMAPYEGAGSNILDAVDLSIDELRSASGTLPSGPKAIVLVSDGRDNASTTTFDAVVAGANDAGIPVFTIGVGDLTPTGARMLDDLANATGGNYFPAPDNSEIAGAYQQISNQLSNEYLLTFNSTISDCNSHNLQVDVAGNGSEQTSFQRCTSSGGGDGGGDTGGGGGGGGGGSTGLLELVLGAALAVGFARRRRARRPVT